MFDNISSKTYKVFSEYVTNAAPVIRLKQQDEKIRGLKKENVIKRRNHEKDD